MRLTGKRESFLICGLRATSAAKKERLFRQVRKLAKGGSFLVNGNDRVRVGPNGSNQAVTIAKETSEKGFIAGI
jgi:hypothetical protein